MKVLSFLTLSSLLCRGVDKDNNFYVADPGNNRVQVFNLDGIFFGQIRSGKKETSSSRSRRKTEDEEEDKPLPMPYLETPDKVAVDSDGNIYVLDGGSAKVHAYTSQGDPQFSIDIKNTIRVKGTIKTLDIDVSNENIYVLTDQNINMERISLQPSNYDIYNKFESPYCISPGQTEWGINH